MAYRFQNKASPMKKLTLALFMVVICSYFIGALQSVEASERHHSTRAAKHHAFEKKHKIKSSKQERKGIASWYGPRFHGKKTASGEKFNMYAMTAASKTLPLLSYARVTNVKNNRSVIVRINDRGSLPRRRTLDLSYAAAKEIGLKGVSAVKITPLGSRRG
jgi:rare lipoprotein A